MMTSTRVERPLALKPIMKWDRIVKVEIVMLLSKLQQEKLIFACGLFLSVSSGFQAFVQFCLNAHPFWQPRIFAFICWYVCIIYHFIPSVLLRQRSWLNCQTILPPIKMEKKKIVFLIDIYKNSHFLMEHQIKGSNGYSRNQNINHTKHVQIYFSFLPCIFVLVLKLL